jgi:hypothetical protein
MVILTKFLDFVMFGTGDLGHNGEKLKKNIFSLNHHIYPIFHAENNLSKLQFNFAHFSGPILTLRGPASLFCLLMEVSPQKYGTLCILLYGLGIR